MEPKGQRKSLVFLAGFMGCGKSTIGPILANALGWDFVDIDKNIEANADQSIADIFSSRGEQSFRALERDALRDLLVRNECVVSLGGGTMTNEENFELIHRHGIIIYLQLSPGQIVERVKHRTDRPLLKDATGKPLVGAELQKRIDGLLEQREQYYSKADIIIPADTMKVGLTVDAIVKKLKGKVP